MSYSILVQGNRFLDNHPPTSESLEVKSIGKYYQPFRVDYLEGQSKKLNKLVRVPVLPEKAEATAIGEQVPIVVGTGLLGKDWVAPKDKHEEYSTSMFKTLYLGIFCLLFALISFLYFKVARKQNKIGWASRLFIMALGVSLLLFYAI
jgi:hypothetical protein